MKPLHQKLVMGAVVALTVVVCVLFYQRKKPAPSARHAGDDVVLARVNGAPISQYDVELAVKTTFGMGQDAQGVSRETMLESMVQSRAIASAAEAELTELERQELDKKLAQHRDQLLVQRYLAKHAHPHDVDDDMVRKYYDEHPELFGGSTTKQFELVGSERALTADERSVVLEKLQGAASHEDWSAWAAELQKAKLPIVHRAGDLLPKVIHPRLYQLLEGMQAGRASQTVFIEGRAYVVRITGERTERPKPFAQVQEQIRQSLRPIKVKEAVSRAAAEVMPKAKVTYLKASADRQEPGSKGVDGANPSAKEKVASQR